MQSQPLAELIFKYIKNSLTPEEEKQLNAWRSNDKHNEQFFQLLLHYVKEGILREEYESKERIWKLLCEKAPALKDLKN